MRVGLAIETDAPGGAETMLLQLTQELLGRGHSVVALGVSNPTPGTYLDAGGTGWLTARFSELGVTRELVEVSGPFGFGAVGPIASVIRRHRLEVLHSHEFSMAVHGSLAARMTGRRHVITMHGGTYYAGEGRRRLAMRAAMAVSRHTVAVSHASRRAFAESLGIREEKVEVIHNGVTDFADDEEAGREIREELALDDETVVVLAVGSLLPVKGHQTLLEAWARLPPTEPAARLLIAGRGPEEAPLRRLASELGIGDRVELLGYRSDIPALLDAADVFVMPSISEGLPMAMIEAMLAGKPILGTDVGGISELVPSEDSGLLVPPGDPERLSEQLHRLVSRPELRQRLGRTARGRAREGFTASAMTDAYLRLYAS